MEKRCKDCEYFIRVSSNYSMGDWSTHLTCSHLTASWASESTECLNNDHKFYKRKWYKFWRPK